MGRVDRPAARKSVVPRDHRPFRRVNPPLAAPCCHAHAMSEDLEADSHVADEQASLRCEPARLTVLALVVLGAFEIGRLIAGALIAPWPAEALLGTRAPVMAGQLDLRIGVELIAIPFGVGMAAPIAVPLVKVINRR